MRPAEAAEILIRRREYLRKRIDGWNDDLHVAESGALDRFRAEYGALDVALDAIAEHRLIRAAAQEAASATSTRNLEHVRSPIPCRDPDCEVHHPEVIENPVERATALAWFEAGVAAR